MFSAWDVNSWIVSVGVVLFLGCYITGFGGGDPDRTGDPRLMSPLLCQLSYTATSRELMWERNLTRGGRSVSTERRGCGSMLGALIHRR